MKKKGRNWLFALMLTTPMVVFFLGYLLNHDASLNPTGFIQYDNVSYIAYARQYTELGHSSIFYNNPFNDSANYPAIYFQPQTLLFALLLQLGVSPGWILIPFTLLCSLLCFRLLIGIYDHLVPASRYRIICISLLAWGGGLLAFSGFLAKTILGTATVPDIFHLDPGAGWWGLNLGRSLFFSCEAWYHLLFLAVIFCLLKQKWRLATYTCLILSLSHPFTGLELLSVLAAWVCLEKFAFANKKIPTWFVAATLLLLCFHIYYYLWHLPRYGDHRSVSSQYELNWRLRFFSMIPAYCLAAAFAVFSVWKIKTGTSWLQKPANRLLLTWFIVAFALANHELFIKARQPIHFTRGYIWTSLMLIGLPALQLLFEKCRGTMVKKTVAAFFVLLLLSDNLLWIGLNTAGKATMASIKHIDKDQQAILDKIDETADTKTLIISRDEVIPYLATIYTNAYSWVSHPFTTPFVEEKKKAIDLFIETGAIDPAWKNRKIIFLFSKNDAAEMKREAAMPFPANRIFESSSMIMAEANL